MSGAALLSLFGEQGMGTPDNRGLPMIIAGNTGTVEIILMVVFLAGAYAHLLEVVVVIDIVAQAKPCPTSHWRILGGIEPAVIRTDNHGVGEDSRA